MCGIFGWSFIDGTNKRTEKLIMAASLAHSMEARGDDSWGFYVPYEDVLEKKLGPITSSLAAADLAQHNLILVHTRKATTGAVTSNNCHPWRFNEIVGAHNGIVTNHFQLNMLYDRDCSVDSQHIFLHIEEGHDLKDIRAYGAVEFATPGHKEINLAAFNGGQLSACEIPGVGMAWASTKSALTKAMSLSGLDGKFYEVKEDLVYIAREGVLYETTEPFNVGRYETQSYMGFRGHSGIDAATGRIEYVPYRNDPWDDAWSDPLTEEEDTQAALEEYLKRHPEEADEIVDRVTLEGWFEENIRKNTSSNINVRIAE